MYFRVNLSRDEHTARENGATGKTLRNSVWTPKVYSSFINCIIYYTLPDFPPRRHPPAAHHLFVAQQKHFIVHVDAGADVVGNYGDDLTHAEPAGGAGNIQVTVLLVELDEPGVRRFDHVAVAGLGPGTERVGREGLRSRVDHGPARHRSRNHGRDHARRAIFEPARALIEGVEVVVGVRPRPDFRDPRNLVREVGRGSRAAGDDRYRHEGLGKSLKRLPDSRCHPPGFVATLGFRAPDVPVVGHEAAKLQSRQRLNLLGELHAGQPGLDAAAPEPGVKLYQHPEDGAL